MGFGGGEKNEENEEWLARVFVRICVWIRGRKGQPVLGEKEEQSLFVDLIKVERRAEAYVKRHKIKTRKSRKD